MPKVVNIAWSLLVLGQSLTFRTPQLYQEMEIALTEKEKKNQEQSHRLFSICRNSAF